MQSWFANKRDDDGAVVKKAKVQVDPADVVNMIQIVAKLSLSVAMRVRMIEGCLFYTFLLKEDNTFVRNASSALENYRGRTKNNGAYAWWPCCACLGEHRHHSKRHFNW